MGVVSTKLGTKAFGQTQASPTSANSINNNLTTEDLQKLGGDSVGDVLNKVSDPNWVDPGKKMRTVGNDKLDKDAFFKLMMAQMKNQDPTSPMQSHEMAAQLANFSSLEQMQNMNQTLTAMKEGQKPMEQFQVLQFLGKSVAGDSSKVFRARGDKFHEFQFNLPMKAKETELRVKNADGEVVKTYKLQNLKEGSNKIDWNGQDDKGTVMPEGPYQIFIEAKNEQGQKLSVKTEFDGVISGVNYTAEGPVLLVGNQSIRLKDVKKIVDPNLKETPPKAVQTNDPMAKAAAEAMVPNQNGTNNNPQLNNENLNSEGAPAAPAKSKIMDQVGLSRDMMDKLAKETNPN